MPKIKNGDEERLEIHIPTRRKLAPKRVMPYVHTNVPENRAFLTIDGRRIRNLMELADMLDQMDDHAFRHHANCERNDFSNWIKDVMGDSALAESIRDKDRRGTQVEVLKRIVKGLMS